MKLTSDMLRQMVRMVMRTHLDEIGCQECFEELDHFAELALTGKSPEEALPLVEEHLERCTDCRDEFEALLDALRAANGAS